MEVPTVTRVGDHDVIRNMPFMQIKMALAAGHKTTRKYPAFDPFAVASEDGEPSQVASRHLVRRRGQGRKRHEHQDHRLSDGDGGLRREERAFRRRGRGGRPLDRLGADRRRGASGRTSLYRPAAVRHLRCRAGGQRALWRQDRRAERLGRPARAGGRGQRPPTRKTSSPSPKTATSRTRWPRPATRATTRSAWPTPSRSCSTPRRSSKARCCASA